MTVLNWIAAILFFLQLPNPLFWLVLHPPIAYWRRHVRASYITALVIAWGLVTVFLVAFHRAIFRNDRPASWAIVAGFALIVLDLWLFSQVHRDLGLARLIGRPELSAGGEIARGGIYAHLRHPRYTGMIASVLGTCLLGVTRWMWCAAGVWLLLVLAVIALEERELRARFGDAYADYCRRTPRFIPYRTLLRARHIFGRAASGRRY